MIGWWKQTKKLPRNILQTPELLFYPPPESNTALRKEIDPDSQHEVVLKLTEVIVDEGRARRNSININVGGRDQDID